jgi:regulator of RNase E activity RraA
MKERGSVGALIDGGIRDIRWIKEQAFSIFARYRTPVQSIGRWKVSAHQVPVKLRGATSRFVEIAPGDFILGDDDGVIIIPAAIVSDVLKEAEKLTQIEVQIRNELSNGLPLADALRKFGHV